MGANVSVPTCNFSRSAKLEFTDKLNPSASFSNVTSNDLAGVTLAFSDFTAYPERFARSSMREKKEKPDVRFEFEKVSKNANIIKVTVNSCNDAVEDNARDEDVNSLALGIPSDKLAVVSDLEAILPTTVMSKNDEKSMIPCKAKPIKYFFDFTMDPDHYNNLTCDEDECTKER